MKRVKQGLVALIVSSAFSMSVVWAHGDVVPQAIDTTGLEPIGKDWVEHNPYRGNERAIHIGQSAYGQNCARCHGLEAVSGGIAPDLRNLPNGDEGDEFYKMRVQTGAIRNGVTYMPAFDGVVSQEGLWAIRSWLESVSVETAEAKDKTPATKTEAAATESTPVKDETAKTEPAKTEATAEPAKAETITEATKTEPAKTEATAEPAKADASKETKPSDKAQ